MTCIGSIRDAERAMTDEEASALWAQQRIQGFCGGEGIEDFSLPVTAAQRAMPYLAVPRDPAPRPVRTEAELLRERVAALEVKLAAALAAVSPKPAQSLSQPGIRHGLAAWPGRGALNQRTGKADWW